MLESINYYKTTTLPASEHYYKRTTVENLLKNAFKKPLTTVIAGAGYGKTQAVLETLKSIKCKSAWIPLSKLDNHVARFWERIAYSFQPYSQSLCKSLITIGYPESIAVFDQFLRLLVSEITQKERFILVFDDFHLIQNKTILNFIDLLISACIQNFSIVLISRKKPDISLSGMLSKGLLARITEDDLRFSKEEMKEYFQKQGIFFEASLLPDIYFYTSGWIFAIFLVGLAAQKGDICSLNPILSTKIDIFDLIEKEIFGVASKELQDYLLRVSILEIIPSGLLKELADNNFALISEMAQLSLIVSYDPLSDSYRFHHLFREFLTERKGRLKEVEFIKVHLTAARWNEKNGHKYKAIDHYKKCGCYKEIFHIILPYTHHVAKETANMFIELIEEAPDKIIREMPIMRIVKANYMFNNNRLADAKQELQTIQKEYEAQPETEENLAILGEVYITLALISIVNLDYEFVELSKKADRCLPGGSKLVDYRLIIAEGLNVCSINDPSPGELKRHQDALFKTAPYLTRAMNGCGFGLEYLNAAESSLYTGDLKVAEKYAYEAIYRSQQYRQYDIEYMANFVLVRIFTAKGNYEKVSGILNQMKTELETLQVLNTISLYDIINGWFYVKIANTDKIAKWIKYEEETRKILAPVIVGREYLIRSDCLLAEERYYELLAFMGQTDKMYEDRGILFAVIQNKITKAIIHHSMGDHTESIKMLNEAYELTHPNHLVMQFIEYGNKMRTLIYAAKSNADCKIPKEWLNTIYTRSSTYAKMLSKIVSAYNTAHAIENTEEIKLSKRELEVLAYLYHGMTREEIAATCYLSSSTINSVLKNIFNKLGAFNTADAIRIAKEKSLL